MNQQLYREFLTAFEELTEVGLIYLQATEPKESMRLTYAVGYDFDNKQMEIRMVNCCGAYCDYETFYIPLEILFNVEAAIQAHKQKLEAQKLEKERADALKKKEEELKKEEEELSEYLRLKKKYGTT